MAFLATMLLIVFVLLTLIALLAGSTTERFHRAADPIPLQLVTGLAGLAIAVPLAIFAQRGRALLGLSVANVIAGLGTYGYNRRRARRAGT